MIWDGKNRLVLWSGGCDSTLVLLWALQAKNAHVRTISLTHPQLGANAEQAAARKKLKKKLEKKYGKFGSLEFSLGDGVINQYGMVQPVMWITNAAMTLLEHEDLMVGYIKGDDVWHYQSEIFTIFQICQKLTKKKGEILFPLEWVDKGEVIRYLHEEGLLKDTFWCERPKSIGILCGECGSCEIHSMYKKRVKLTKIGADKASTGGER